MLVGCALGVGAGVSLASIVIASIVGVLKGVSYIYVISDRQRT